MPADPTVVAPPIDPTLATDFLDVSEFIAFGPQPIQRGLPQGLVERYSAAILRGRVLDEDGQPLPGVLVRILDHPEFGYTYSRFDGHYDLLVNGGGDLILDFQKSDRLRVQRQLRTTWRDWALVDDLRMIALDAQMTAVVLGPSAPAQLASGSSILDEDGTRQARVFFPAGTEAMMTLSDGREVAMPVLNFRATEYTVGAGGPERMPGQLPPTSAYTYAVELSADQALAVGAKRVQFSQPVGLYVDNFLGFPVGQSVPAGWYDFRAGSWAPSDNGRVIKIIGVENALAQIDIDGSGLPATAEALTAMGISGAERARLAQSYAVGAELWRTPLDHLTPWDCNWPYVPPDDVEEPTDPDFEDDPDGGDDDDDPANDPDDAEDDDESDDTEDEACEEGSIYYCRTQSMGLQLPIPGAAKGLSYRSDRTSAGTVRSRLSLRLTSKTLPASLRSASVTLQLLGVRQVRTLHLVPAGTGRQRFQEPKALFDLQSRDAYQRIGWQGALQYSFELRYGYEARYVAPGEFTRAFARFSGLSTNGGLSVLGRSGSEITLTKQWRPESLPLAKTVSWNAEGQALGGWSIDSHQVLDPAAMVVISGAGAQRKLERARAGIGGATMTRSTEAVPPGILARQTTPAGGLVALFDQLDAEDLRWDYLHELRPDGQLIEIAKSCLGYEDPEVRGAEGGHDCPAGSRKWYGVTAGPQVDARGRVLLIDSSGLLRIERSGEVDQLLPHEALSDASCFGDNVQMATHLDQVYLGCAAHIYVADQGGLAHVAGGGSDAGEGVSARFALLDDIGGMTADQDGNLIVISGNRIRRISAQGLVTTLAGNGAIGLPHEGGLAIEQPLGHLKGVAVDREGLVHFGDWVTVNYSSHAHLREISRDGRIFTLAGGGAAGWDEQRGVRVFARSVKLDRPPIPLPLPDGAMRIAEWGSNTLLTLGHTLADTADEHRQLIVEEDGSVIQEFSSRGRHLRTLHPLTGGVLESYEYDESGRIRAVLDGFGNRTSIARSASGFTIAGPWGSSLIGQTDAQGRLVNADLAGGGAWIFETGWNGLYARVVTPEGRQKFYEWHPLRSGRLLSTKDASGQIWNSLPSVWPVRQAKSGQRHSPEYRSSHASVEFGRLTGVSRYTVRRNRSFSHSNERLDGSGEYSDSQGRAVETQDAFDPQFPLARYAKRSQGLGAVVEQHRDYQIAGDGSLGTVDRTETTVADGRTYTRHYDSATRTWTSTSPQGRQHTAQFNLQGQPVRQTVGGLADVAYHYRADGRLDEVRVGAGAEQRVIRLGYGAQGYLDWIEDPAGRRVSYDRDVAGRPEQITLPDSRVIGLGWDAESNLTRVTPPGRPAHEFDYTPTNRLAAYRPPSAGAGDWHTDYPRDLDSELTAAVRPDGLSVGLVRGFPLSSAVSGVTYSRGTRHLSRTGGRIDLVSEGDNQLHLSWDEEVLGAQIWSGTEISGRVDYIYGSARRINGLSVLGGAAVSYGYDNDNLLASATVFGSTLTLTRHPANGLLQGTQVGGLGDSWTHNDFAEPMSYQASYGATSLMQASYTRDRLGRIGTRSESAGGAVFAEAYGYELSGRLDTVHRGGALVSDYGFDTNGNRTSHRIGAASPLRGRVWPCLGDLAGTADVTIAGSFDAQDRMQSYGTCQYEYTRNGELTRRTDSASGAVTNYQYDEFGNLRGVDLPDGRVVSYHIDGLNRRVGKSIDGVRQWGLLYANQLEPVAELDGAGNIVASFLYADRPHVPSLMLKGGHTYRILSDHLGSVRLVIDLADGSIAQRLAYDEYGNVVEDTHPGFQPFAYAGGLYDRDTGLTRFGARDYDPLSGRWTAKDPIRFWGGDGNVYAYVGNDPVNYIDPSGLFNPVKAIVAASVALNGVRKASTAGISAGLSAAGFASAQPEFALPFAGKAIWDAASADRQFEKSMRLFDESLDETMADCSYRNLSAAAPFGENYDDAHEPSAWDWAKEKWQEKTIWENVVEIGAYIF